ncbi:putative kinase [Xanthomonas phage Xoo-sp13]|nr:putative kinase [Xanthomonas phage Xoo-sp13]
MTAPKVIVMVGLPGSGKDFIINRMLKDNPGDYYIASTDAFIEAAATEQGKTYSEVFDDEIKKATQRMNCEVDEAIRQRRSVIWNQTNMARKKRVGILSRFPKDYYKTCVVVTAPTEIHLERVSARAKATGKHISTGIIMSMQASYIEPSTEEGFDEIVFVHNN